MPEHLWILYATMDTDDGPILESFGEQEGPPTGGYIQEMYGAGFLFKYDIDGSALVNERPCAPKGFDIPKRKRRRRRKRKPKRCEEPR
jgi:hypothetical protein